MPGRRPADAVSPEVLLEHREWVRALARSLVGDRHLADDVEQETWRMALERPPRHARSLRAWFGTVVRNAARGMRRREAIRTRLQSVVPQPPASPSPADLLAEAEVQHKLVQAVIDLDEPYRTVVLYRWFEGMEAREIAARLGVPVETVRTRLKRAVQTLRSRMETELGDDRRAWALLLFGAEGNGATEASPIGASAAAAAGGGVLAMTAGKLAVLASALLLGAFAVWWSALDAGDEAAKDVVAKPKDGAATSESRASSGRAHPETLAPVKEDAATKASVSRVSGRVVDADDRPVRGARVTWTPYDVSDSTPSVAAKPSPGAAISADDGSFLLPLEQEDGQGLLVVDAPDFAPASVAARPGAKVSVRLDRGISLAGAVMDMQGRPVQGAVVTFVDRDRSSGARVERAGTSDASGAYRVSALPVLPAVGRGIVAGWSRTRSVEARAAGFAPLLLFMEWNEVQQPFNLVLVKGSTLRGRVVDAETSRPLAGAQVSFFVPGYGDATHASRVAAAETTEDGKFELSHIPAAGFHQSQTQFGSLRHGRVLLGHLAAWKEGRVIVSKDVTWPSDGAVLDFSFELRPTAVVEGTLTFEDGRPASGRQVWADAKGYETDGWAWRWVPQALSSVTMTGPDGQFRLSGVPALRDEPTRVALRTFGPDRETLVGAVTVVAGQTVRDVRLVTPTRPTLNAVLRVEDGNGAPVVGARVQGNALGTWTGSDGIARLSLTPHPSKEGMPQSVPVLVHARGFAIASLDVTLTPSEPAEVRVRLCPGKTLRGRVEDEQGRTVSGLALQVLVAPTDLATLPRGMAPTGSKEEQDSDEEDHAPSPPPEPRPALPPAPVDLTATRSAADGSFVVDDLPDLPLTLRPVESGSPGRDLHLRWTFKDLTGVRPGGSPVRLVVGRARVASQPIEIVIRDAETGALLADADARATSGGRGPSSRHEFVRALAPGRLGFDLRMGTWKIEVTARDHVSAVLDGIVATETAPLAPLTVSLARGATVRGVLRSSKKLFPSPVLQLRHFVDGAIVGFFAQGDVQPDGRFVVRGVPPGRHLVEVAEEHGMRTPWVPRGGKMLEVPPDAVEIEANLDIVPGSYLQVAYEDPRLPGGHPEPTEAQLRLQELVTVEARDADGNLVAWYRGQHRMMPVPPGDLTVRFILPGDAPREATVRVEPGRTADVRFKAR